MNNFEPSLSSDLLLVGKVIRPHGLRGLLRITTYSESEDSSLQAGTVFFKTVLGEIRKHAVISLKAHKNVFLMKLKGLESRDKAEEYKSAEILIEKESLAQKDDAYFWHELLGLEVYLEDGKFLGTITQIIPTEGNDIYVVKNGKREVLIPAVYDVIKEIDLEYKKMTISPNEGLLDLYEV